MARLGRLRVAWKINDAWWLDNFFAMVAEGKRRIGKSSYINQGMAEAHGKWEVVNKSQYVRAQHWNRTLFSFSEEFEFV